MPGPEETDHKGKKQSKSVKNQLRSLQRLLRKPNLDPKVREGVTKRISDLENDVEEKHQEDQEKSFRKKYKLVRFLELRKLVRKIKKVEDDMKTHADDEVKQEDLAKELARLKDDEMYIEHFPAEMKYISLFPKEDATPEKTAKARDDIKTLIRERLAAAPAPPTPAQAAPAPVQITKGAMRVGPKLDSRSARRALASVVAFDDGEAAAAATDGTDGEDPFLVPADDEPAAHKSKKAGKSKRAHQESEDEAPAPRKSDKASAKPKRSHADSEEPAAHKKASKGDKAEKSSKRVHEEEADTKKKHSSSKSKRVHAE